MPGKRRSQRYVPPPPLPPQPPLQPQPQGSSRLRRWWLLARSILTTPPPLSPSPSQAPVSLLSVLPWNALEATMAFLTLPGRRLQRRVSVAQCEAWLRQVNQRPTVQHELWLSFSFPVLRKLIHKGYFSRRTSSSSAAAAAAASPTLLLGTFPRLRCVSVYQVHITKACSTEDGDKDGAVAVPPEDLNVVLAALPSTLTSLRLENVHHNVSYVHGKNSSSSGHSGGGRRSNGNGGGSGHVAVGGMDDVPLAASNDTNDTSNTNTSTTHLTALHTLQIMEDVPSWLPRLCEDLPALTSLYLPSYVTRPVAVLVSGGGGGIISSSSSPLAALVTEVSFSASDVANHHVPWAAFPNLTKLNVSGNPMHDAGVRTVLSHCSRLTSLSVHITREAAAAFSTPPAAAATLQELDLKFSCYLHLEDLGHLTCLTSLQSLDLSYAFEDLRSGSVGHSLLSSLSRLTTVNLCGCHLTSAVLGAVCGGLRSLRQVNLSKQKHRSLGSSLPPEVLQLSRLRDLDLSWIDLGGASASAVVIQHVSDHLTALQRLNLSHWSLTMVDVRPLTRLPRLWSLDLSGNEQLTTRGVDVLSQLTQLSELSISCCKLSEKGVHCVGRLTRLEILNAAGLGDSAVAAFRCLSALTQLVHLHVAHNHISTPDACHVLRQLTRLWGLGISNNHLHADVSAVLSQRVTSLRFLDVNGNRLGDRGVARLSTLTALRVLRVENNNVTKDSTLASLVLRLQMLRELCF